MLLYSCILILLLCLQRLESFVILPVPAASLIAGSTTSSLGSLFPTPPPNSKKSWQKRRVNGDANAYEIQNHSDTTTVASAAPTAPTAAAAANTSSSSSVEGIGGQGGVVYDVNRLKRNLLQETIQAYKKELWNLLQSPISTEEEIAEKLAALVQSSAVRTTTDSNLLDGTWTLAYSSKYATVQDLKTTRPQFPGKRRRPRIKRNEEIEPEPLSPQKKRTTGKEALIGTKQRTFHLEELDETEDAYIVDNLRLFGGFLTRKRRMAVRGLSRTDIRLEQRTTQWDILGQTISAVSESTPKNHAVGVVYIDVDLAVLAETASPQFLVYTKNPEWTVAAQRSKRKIRFLAAGVKYFFLRNRIKPLAPSRSGPEDDVDRVLQIIEAESTRLRVLRLGDLSMKEDESWSADIDPFVHLSADERQDVLKKMNFRQIEKASNKRLATYKRERWFQRLLRKRHRSFFKKPDGL